MAIGTSRRTTFGKEKSGWGGFYTTVKTAASSSATTLILNGSGGTNYGVPTVVIGMKVFFLDDLTEAPKVISAVTISGGDATLTIPALASGVSANENVLVGWFPTNALLVDSFNTTLNKNKWSPNPFTGTRAKNYVRKTGRTEADGSMQATLYPTVNSPMIANAVGQDITQVGTVPGTPVSTTITSGATVGSISVVVSSATGLAVNDTVTFDRLSSTIAETRKITAISTNTLTLDNGLTYAHANTTGTVDKSIAPFIHTIPSAGSNLNSLVIEDYIPYDDLTQANGVSLYSYILTGVLLKSLKVESQSEQGATVSIDYDAQDKNKIPASTPLAIPAGETPFSFDNEAVVIAGTRNFRIQELSLEVDNGTQKIFTKSGFTRAFTIKAGQQDVKGSLKFYQDEVTQSTFWARLKDAQSLSLVWTITDTTTGYYTQFTVPKIVIDSFDDSSFSPADLISGSVNWTAILDAGASNVNLTVVIANGDYLPY